MKLNLLSPSVSKLSNKDLCNLMIQEGSINIYVLYICIIYILYIYYIYIVFIYINDGLCITIYMI